MTGRVYHVRFASIAFMNTKFRITQDLLDVYTHLHAYNYKVSVIFFFLNYIY